MQGRQDAGPIAGEGEAVESDETFAGGKAKYVHNGKPAPKKHPVVPLVERDGEMRVKHVADVTAETVRESLVTMASRKSHLMPDDSLVFDWAGREFAKHDSVTHCKDEYVRGKAHVNSAESYSARLKRGIMGSFHSVSEQHLKRYADEFATLERVDWFNNRRLLEPIRNAPPAEAEAASCASLEELSIAA